MSPVPLLMMCLLVSLILGGVHMSNIQILVGTTEYPYQVSKHIEPRKSSYSLSCELQVSNL